MLDHYVVFQPHRGREEELSAALRDFAAGITGLTCVQDFTWGENTNASGLKHGYTHGCFARLTGEAALRGDYWNHPAHQKLLGRLDELCIDRFALDYRVSVAADER
ncbi:Dabb family protein [Pseudonocardia sp. Cha107L01]|uniref:Dabb family protein n=1 Tax=Pseudonocardia sp. Cha107L01 TaxID=3457576 RepID=UPI00403E866F